MTVENIMTKPVVTVGMDDSLRQVKEIFDHVKFHHLVVTEDEKICGIISDRDLFKAISPAVGTIAETAKDAAMLNKKVHQIMTRKPVTLFVDQTIYDAVTLFNEHPISSLPVVNREKMPIGIISWRDIIRLINPDTFKTVES